jgi:general secretion pathway protein L
MARLFIGADVDAQTLRVVCLEQTGQGEVLRAIARREIDGVDAAAAALAELVTEWEAAGARIATALTSAQLFARPLDFPFTDRRKIAAVAPLMLAEELPESLDAYLTSVLPALSLPAGGARGIALALPQAEVAAFVAPFDQQHLPVRVIDLFPFAAVAGLAPPDTDGILVLVRESGYAVVRFVESRPLDHLLTPFFAPMTEDLLASAIARDVRSLPGFGPAGGGRILLAGPGVTPALQRALIGELPEAKVPEVFFEENRLAAEYLPALALARRAGRSDLQAGCNLRQGRFAYRGSLAPFRRSLIAAALLLGLALLAAGAAAYLNHAGKAAAYQRLQQELQSIYQQSFPGAPPVADVPLYLNSRLQALRAEGRLLGSGPQRPLPVLDALSRAIATLPAVAVTEWDFDLDGVQVAGQAKTFDDVDRFAARLGAEALFAEAQIAEAKTALDGSRVDFRISLRFAAGGEDQ